MKKIASIVLALVLVLAMAAPAMAAETVHTITITNAVAGHTYEAYQIFKGDLSTNANKEEVLSSIEWGAGVNGEALLTALKADSTIGSYFTECTTAIGVADVLAANNNNAGLIDRFAEIAGENLSGTVAGTSSTVDGGYQISVTGDGYYLVKDKDDSDLTEDAFTKYILQVVGDVEVAAKADAPEIDKKIVEGDSRVDANNASIGDEVRFEITSNVPDMDGYDKYFFIVNDTLSAGLAYDETKAAWEVTLGTTQLKKCDCTADATAHNGCDYYVEKTDNSDGTTSLKIVFINFIQYKNQKNEAITINYTAIVDEDAVIGTSGNTNKVDLTYSNNPNEESNGNPEKPDEPDNDDPIGETPDEITITYVTEIELTKEDDEGNRLTGAEFTIAGTKLNKVKVVKEVYTAAEDGTYYLLKDGTYTEDEATENTKDSYVDPAIKYKKEIVTEWNTTTEKVSATGVVGSDGVLTFTGLAEGTYTITEIVAPTGYNILTDPITVVITCTEPTTVTTGAETAEWKYTLSGAITADEKTAKDGKVTITVENKAGNILPETGGIGTTIFYVAGGLLMVGALVLLITKRKVESK